MQEKFQARYYAGGSGKSIPVEITIGEDGHLEIHGENTDEHLMLSQFELEVGGHAEDRIKLFLPESGVAIVSEDRNLISSLAASSDMKISMQAKNALAKIASHGKTHKIYWGKIIAICTGSLLGLYFLVDFLAVRAIANIDPKTEMTLGKFLAPEKNVERDGPYFERVDKIAKRLLAHLQKNPYEFTFGIKNDDTINACAYPGGTVLVNKGLVDKATSDDEIAGVMAHEIGHVIHRDSLKRIAHSAGVWALLQLLIGLSSGKDLEKVASALSLAGDLEYLQYNRSQEADADRTAVQLTLDSNYRGDAIIAFFERLQKDPASADNKIFAVLSTHPMNEERIKSIKSQLAELNSARGAKK